MKEKTDRKPMKVAIAGTGWRAQFFIRICAALPERFQLIGIMYHSEKGLQAIEDYDVPKVDSVEALIALKPDYIVLALRSEGMTEGLRLCAKHQMPVLCETFMVKTLEELNELYEDLKDMKLQFAEQYQFQPMTAARLTLAKTGVLGKIYQSRVAISARYHAVSVLRLSLDAKDELPLITGHQYTHSVLKGPGRNGDPVEEAYFDSKHELFIFDYGDRQGIADFEDMQHRSFMRSNDFILRGSRGEVHNGHVVYMQDELTPIDFDMKRIMTGENVDLQGLFLRGVSGAQRGWLYKNEFMPARLYDDELAVASCMQGMADYLQGESAEGGSENGRIGFYGLKEELTDMYFALLMEESIQKGISIQAEKQRWME